MPDPARDGGDADQEHHRSGGKQETQKPDHKAHYRSSIPSLEQASTELKHARGSYFCLSMISAQTRSADIAREPVPTDHALAPQQPALVLMSIGHSLSRDESRRSAGPE